MRFRLGSRPDATSETRTNTQGQIPSSSPCSPHDLLISYILVSVIFVQLSRCSSYATQSLAAYLIHPRVCNIRTALSMLLICDAELGGLTLIYRLLSSSRSSERLQALSILSLLRDELVFAHFNFYHSLSPRILRNIFLMIPHDLLQQHVPERSSNKVVQLSP
ncbi:uncharacterized protein SCHCODRAFT_02092777 [Schizophyllum commune H4-8]|uniref:uncharacterized protein n=1 Tax=Schizophyllum commune (strain H4-8 / FGSC 9210) TaxID=578458 RepID=UPI002160D734|nr:uncharacterized protein SCHCODRAFT_02092777 [Schizophyllum commune H4-8]KAI5887290.1 hypothetical protein SCHCODRAFT_02092777 [Schizophyllum commune H4-8]